MIYRICGVDETVEQGWKGYTISVLMLALVSIVAVYLILRLQASLPLNANGAGPMSPDLSFNTAVSFATNTNWQNYSGETATSNLAQAGGLVVQMFVSAAMGLAVAIALVRGLVRRSASTLGNFWVDITRGVLYVLLPISIVAAVILIWQGVPQTLNAPSTITTLQGAHQTLSIGPIASQEAIKELGNNGGGFLNANSAHPFENPTGLSNFLEMFLILLAPFALTYTFGRYAGKQRQGWVILGAMAFILVVGAVFLMHVEAGRQPALPGRRQPGPGQHGGQGGSASARP